MLLATWGLKSFEDKETHPSRRRILSLSRLGSVKKSSIRKSIWRWLNRDVMFMSLQILGDFLLKWYAIYSTVPMILLERRWWMENKNWTSNYEFSGWEMANERKKKKRNKAAEGGIKIGDGKIREGAIICQLFDASRYLSTSKSPHPNNLPPLPGPLSSHSA